jgi:hypothetical protein
LSVSTIDPQTFSQSWIALPMPGPGKIHHAYKFLRFNTKTLAGLQINLAGSETRMTQDVWWDLNPNFAKAKAVLTLTDCEESVYLEWEVPTALTIGSVSSPNLLRWSVSPAGPKRQVQVWLTKPDGTTTVTLTCWQAQKIKEGPFPIPRLALMVPQSCPTTIHVNVVKGLSVRPLNAKQMTLITASPQIKYETKDQNYSATVLVERTPVLPEVDTLIQAERHGDSIHVSALVHYTIPVGELKSVHLMGRGWHGKDVTLEAPGLIAPKATSKGEDVIWKFQPPPGTTQQFSVKISGKFPLGTKGTLQLPSLEVADAVIVHRWLALPGEGLQATQHEGITLVKEPVKHLGMWPALAEQFQQQGKLWKIEEKNWSLKVALPAAAKKDVQVLFAEQSAFPASAGQWLYQAEYLLTAEHLTELQFAVPPNVILVALRLDGQEVPVDGIAGPGIKVALSPGSPIHQLLVRWKLSNSPAGENLEYQSLLFHGIEKPAMLCTVQVPPGQQVAAESFTPTGVKLLSVGAMHLYRAEAQLKLTAALASKSKTGTTTGWDTALTQIQRSFYWHCRQAQQCLAQDQTKTGLGPKGESLAVWLKSLQEKNVALAAEHQFEPLRQLAETQPAPASPWPGSLALLPPRGNPIGWYLPSGAAPDGLRLALIPDSAVPDTSWIVRLLLVVLVAGLVLSLVPGGAWLVRFLWPEQLAALILVGGGLLGPSLIAGLLLLLAVAVRLAWLFRKTWKLLQHRPALKAPVDAT